MLFLARSVLPELLIDRRGWERLDARASSLPLSAAEAAFGFECRLGDAEASADLLLSVPPNGRFADALVRPGVVGEGSSAASLARFLTRWRRPASSVVAEIDFVALEYDVVGVVNAAAPGFFLRSAGTGGFADPGLLSRVIAAAAGWNEDPAETRGIAHVLSAVPPGAAVRWGGAFPDREPRAVRLVVRALDNPAAFLRQIGWVGDAQIVVEIASEFDAAGISNLVLALDVIEGDVSPSLGIELSQPGRVDTDWREALALMVRKEWCRPDRAAAFGAANRSERIYAPSGVSELVCHIHHVKLAVGKSESGETVPHDRVGAAKGYVVCALRPLS